MRLRLACAAVFFAAVPLHTLSQEVVLSRPSTGPLRVAAARRPAPNVSDAAPARLGIHILRDSAEGISCQQLQGRPAIRDLDFRSSVSLHQINHLREGAGKIEKASTGLTINLRATAQLEQYPQAKAAFIQAVDIWESMLSNNLTLYVDVDFGPTWFGESFPNPDILGATQSVLYESAYSNVRQQLVGMFPSDAEMRSLPLSAVPTDLGGVEKMVIPDAAMRAIGLQPSQAIESDPTPNIGFNSAFTFDFDPRDGLGQYEIDFLGVALHELGHVLGFTSVVGVTELDPLEPASLSMLDLHRFRPGSPAFGTDPRVLSSGGDQVYFTYAYWAPLSTARADGTGGDLHQPSHWKDDQLLGAYVGLMDPTLRHGAHLPITLWDLVALTKWATVSP